MSKTSNISKLYSSRCALGTLLLLAGCLFWSYMINMLVSYNSYFNPFSKESSFDDLYVYDRLLYHQPITVVSVTIATILVFWLFEYSLRRSRSKIRLGITILATLLTPFILAQAFLKFADFSFEQDIPKTQEFRFGEQRTFLKNAERITLHSIDPLISQEKNKTDKLFHDYKIIGSLDIADTSVIKSIWKDLQDRIYSGNDNLYTMCFDPRHGIRAYQGETFKDYLICFHCHHLYLYDTADGKHKRIGLEGAQVSHLLNGILDAAEIKRDKPDLE